MGLQYLGDTRERLDRASDLKWWHHGGRSESVTERDPYFCSPVQVADYLRALPSELDGTDRVGADAAESRAQELEAELWRLHND